MNLPLSPVRFLDRARDVFGSRTGVICGERRFTYAEFADRAERFAAALGRLGVAPGDRVALLCGNCVEVLEAYLAVPLAGAVFVPLNPDHPAEVLAKLTERTQPALLLYEERWAPLAAQLGAARALPLGSICYQTAPLPRDWSLIDEAAPAAIFHTSGVTGLPKSVEYSHRALYLHAVAVALCFGDARSKIDLHVLPLTQSNGWGSPHACCLMGTTQVLMERFDAAAALALIERHHISHIAVTPEIAEALAAAAENPGPDISSLETLLLGGGHATPDLIERLECLLGCSALAGYGLAETGPVISQARHKPNLEYRGSRDRYRLQSSAGWAIAGVEIRLAGPDQEIQIRSDFLMTRYIDGPDDAEAFDDGWFRTGDAGAWDTDGYLQVLGRLAKSPAKPHPEE